VQTAPDNNLPIKHTTDASTFKNRKSSRLTGAHPRTPNPRWRTTRRVVSLSGLLSMGFSLLHCVRNFHPAPLRASSFWGLFFRYRRVARSPFQNLPLFELVPLRDSTPLVSSQAPKFLLTLPPPPRSQNSFLAPHVLLTQAYCPLGLVGKAVSLRSRAPLLLANFSGKNKGHFRKLGKRKTAQSW